MGVRTADRPVHPFVVHQKTACPVGLKRIICISQPVQEHFIVPRSVISQQQCL